MAAAMFASVVLLAVGDGDCKSEPEVVGSVDLSR